MNEFQFAKISVGQITATIGAWLEDLVSLLPNIAAALLILALSVVVSRRLRTAVEQLLQKLTGNEPVSRLLGSLSKVVAIAVAGLWALRLLHLDTAVTSVLAGVGVVGLALGFAFQDIAANFMSGFIMALYRPFEVGDMVEVAGRQCRVQRLELRATEVETLDGLSIVVPNKAIFESPILNYTRTSTRRMDLSLGTAYGDDMEQVRAAVLEAVRGIPARDLQREPEFFFEAFGDSSINFQVRVWLSEATQLAFMAARSEAMIAIKKAFDRERITIPFPIRTLDFGANAPGGKPIDAMQLRVLSQG